jgi:hypothetical protein
MSQIIKNLAAGPVPPAVPTSFTTDYNADFTATGVSIPVANVENVIGGFTSFDDPDGIATQASPNGDKNLLVLLTNRVRGAQSSVNGATINLIVVPLGAVPACYRFQVDIVARDIASGDGAGYTFFGTIRTDGITATGIATPFIDEDEDASLIPSLIGLATSGNNGILQVTGIAGKTIAYLAVGTYIKV